MPYFIYLIDNNVLFVTNTLTTYMLPDIDKNPDTFYEHFTWIIIHMFERMLIFN